jgi:hypothetical protein
MTIGQRASVKILERLRSQAQALDRPDVRLASIERLVAACDAIESGVAADVHQSAHGSDGGLRRNAKINPSNVEKYVKARCKLGAREWTGPTRVFIASDPDLRAYVAAREDERLKPPEAKKRPSQRQKEIEDAIARLPSVETRQILRHDLEEGRIARRRLDVLSRGLRSLPSIDVDALLRGDADQTASHDALTALPATLPHHSPLATRDVEVLKALLERFSNREEMARAGLETDGRRIRLAMAPRTTIVRPDEMALLRRLAGLEA